MRSGKKAVGTKKAAVTAESRTMTAGENTAEAEFSATVERSTETETAAVKHAVSTDTSGDEASYGGMSGGNVSDGDVSYGDVSYGDVSYGDASGGDVSYGDASGGDVLQSAPTAENTAAAERSARISSIADSIVDKLSLAIDELDATDTQKLRHVVSALKEIKDLQSLSLGDEVTERALRLRELQSKVTSAESDAAPSVREVTVHIDGDNGYSD